MIIAAVVDQNEKILPIVDGIILRLYDTESKQYRDYENPALHLKKGRRGATLRFAEEKGASAFVAPPQTFCELSYEKARKVGIQFYHLDEQIVFHVFLQLIESNQLHIKPELSNENIEPSNVPQ
ncbi:hypothetical protein GN156_15495 [bacterium LRH843]|nr:hypothetical protein [bacterium LRH843]